MSEIVAAGLEQISWERLYRLEIQKFEPPDACASEPARPPSTSRFSRSGQPSALGMGRGDEGASGPVWRRLALVYDVYDRTPEQLKQDVLSLLEGETGRFRINAFYWEGDMVTPQAGRLMGKGEDFLYSDNPRGSIVSKSPEPIEFEIELEDQHKPGDF